MNQWIHQLWMSQLSPENQFRICIRCKITHRFICVIFMFHIKKNLQVILNLWLLKVGWIIMSFCSVLNRELVAPNRHIYTDGSELLTLAAGVDLNSLIWDNDAPTLKKNLLCATFVCVRGSRCLACAWHLCARGQACDCELCPLQLAHCCVHLRTEVLGQTPSALINVVINQSNTDIWNPSGGVRGRNFM